MAYTSEQYKYLLFQHLCKYMSVPVAKDRYYTRDFFQKLFADIEVDESSYTGFMDALEANMKYCAANNVNEASDITTTMVDEQKVLLIEAFSAVGITLEIEASSSSGTATFTKPDGTVMTYYVTDGTNEFYINAVSGQEYGYAKRAAPYFNLSTIDVKELDDEDYQMCGPDCYWSYDSSTATMRITGTGTYIGVTKEAQLGSGTYTTLIFGANVSKLNYNEASNSASLTTIVLLQPASFELTISSFGGINTTRTWDVYTDNEAFRNYSWPSSLTINWHTLDEWEG